MRSVDGRCYVGTGGCRVASKGDPLTVSDSQVDDGPKTGLRSRSFSSLETGPSNTRKHAKVSGEGAPQAFKTISNAEIEAANHGHATITL